MKHVAVIGSGPSGLMLADVLASHGCKVSLFERRNGLARKLFIAGSSGLNVSHDLDHNEFVAQYTPAAFFERSLKTFSVKDWLAFLESLGLKTFLGTSRRYFIEPMNSLPLVRAWKKRVIDSGAEVFADFECTGVSVANGSGFVLSFANNQSLAFDAVAFCLGGGSYEETPPLWPAMFRGLGIDVADFRPSNVGFQVNWPKAFLKEAEGAPLKDIILKTARGEKRGDMVVTAYGLEGTPVYFMGCDGEATLDLKPSLTEEEIRTRLLSVDENLSPLRRMQKKLNLCEATLALLYHLTPQEVRADLVKMVRRLKSFPLRFEGPQPINEAISTRGGIGLNEVNEALMLKKIPGIFVAGEMLDWDAPTGGFLIQGCVSQAVVAAHGVLEYLGVAAQNVMPIE